MQHRKTVVSLVLLVISLLALNALAAGADNIKERMLGRLPAINTMKDKRIIGEDSEGYLQFRGGDQPQKDMISAENKDRRTVYEAIARKEGAQTGLVGQRRARQIEEIGKSGHWFLKADGTWHQKK